MTQRPANKLGRRSFMKMAGMAGALGATGAFASDATMRQANAQELKAAHPGSKTAKTVCAACSVGCGIIAETHNGVWLRQDVAQDHPVSLGGHCCKGADQIDLARSSARLKTPMEKVNGEWKRISWEDAIKKIGAKLKDIRAKNGPDATMFLGSAKFNNEQAYYFRKFAAFYGTNNIDHQARI